MAWYRFVFNKAIVFSLVACAGVATLYTNCSENNTGFSDLGSTSVDHLEASEFYLTLLDDARETVARLNQIGTPQSIAQANLIQQHIDRLEELTSKDGNNLPLNDSVVQSFIDFLIHENSKGNDFIIVYNFEEEVRRLDAKDAELDAKIDRVESELTARIQSDLATLRTELLTAQEEQKADLQARIDSLQTQLETLNQQFNAFRTQITNHITIIENRVEVINNQTITEIKNLITQLELNQKNLHEMILSNQAQIALIDGRYQVITDELKQRIERNEVEVAAKFEVVDGKIVQLEKRVTNIETAIADIQKRLDEYDSYLATINNMIEKLDSKIESVRISTETSLAELRTSIESVRAETQAQIIELKQAQNEMKEALAKQQEQIKTLIEGQKEIANLQGLMCTLDAQGEVIGEKPACTGGEEDILDGSCCLKVAVINCDVLYPAESQSAVRDSCNILKHTLQSLDDRVNALAAQNQEQNQLISKVMEDVSELKSKTENLEATINDVKSQVSELQSDMADAMARIKDLDLRLLIQEFKSSRSEAMAGISERSNHYLAWITQRDLDIRKRFCHSNANLAFDRNDYKVARQNWLYCHERLTWLKKAKEVVYLIQAYTEGLGSTNVDQACTATIAGKSASAITDQDLKKSAISEEVIKKCKSGEVLAKAYMLNLVAMQNTLGPDFRTAAYMAKKAKIVNLIYFGTDIRQVSKEQLMAFENIDPSSPTWIDTVYGRIERVFKNHYVATRLRTKAGAFPESASQLGQTTGLNLVYTHQEIRDAKTDYLKRVKPAEIQGSCSGQCGYKVIGRNNVQRVGQRFAYPEDFKTQCPIWQDTVVVRSLDGKHYAYQLSYSRHQGATEELMPQLRHNNQNHMPLATSDAAVAQGEFRDCGYRVRNIVHRFGMADTFLRGRQVLSHSTPYAKSHGLPQCRRTFLRCDLWQGSDGKGKGSWVATNPDTSNLYHFLSGFTESRILNKCQESGASYVVRKRALDTAEMNRLRVFPAAQDSASVAWAGQLNDQSTQLTDKYWMVQDAAIDYGVENVKVSKTKPHFGVSASHGSGFFRVNRAISHYTPQVDVQQCYDPN